MTLRPKCLGSLIWLYSLPSEKVPAPPSPNCTLLSGFNTDLRHSPQVSWVRCLTACPRSMTIGFKPICAKTSAANMPQGPKPTTTGRAVLCSAQSAGACTGACQRISGVAWICGCFACCCSNCCSLLLSWSSTSTMYTTCSFCRASKLRLNTFQSAIASMEMPNVAAINGASVGGYRGGAETLSAGLNAESSGSLSSVRRIMGA